MSLPGLTGQSSTHGQWLSTPGQPGDDSLMDVNLPAAQAHGAAGASTCAWKSFFFGFRRSASTR